MYSQDDFDSIKDLEREQLAVKEYEKRKKFDKDYEAATEGETFKIFNSVTTAITAVCSLAVCCYFLWMNCRPVLFVVLALVVLSVIFRQLSKYYFRNGNQRKFEAFHRMAKVTGVASSVVELSDVRSKNKGAVDKADNVESNVTNVVSTISETQFKGGVYVDAKYNDTRARANGMGHYIVKRLSLQEIYRMLDDIKHESSVCKVSKDAKLRLSIASMYIRDYLEKNYPKADSELFYSLLGALHFFLHPMMDLPNNVPLVGYKDNMFVLYCVIAGNKDKVSEYKVWKLADAKKSLLHDYTDKMDEIWDSLLDIYDGFESYTKNNDALLEKTIKELCERDDEAKQFMCDVTELISDYNDKVYIDIDVELVHGLTGMLLCFGLDKDIKVDGVCVSDYVITHCCMQRCEEALHQYNEWRALKTIQDEDDPLVEYLNTVIGKNPTDRDIEIKRLSKMCTDSSLKTHEERARSVIKFNLVNTDSKLRVPKDLHQWAVLRNMSDIDALDYIFTLIPEASKTVGDKYTQALAFWKDYKHLLI